MEEKKSAVYIIKNYTCNTYKIGISIDPPKRLKSLRGAGVYGEIVYTSIYLSNARAIEIRAHEHYKDKNIYREWFIDIDLQEAIEVIEKLVEEFGEEGEIPILYDKHLLPDKRVEEKSESTARKRLKNKYIARTNSYVYIVKYYYYGEIRYVYFVSKYEAKIFLNRIKAFAREFEKTKDFSGRILWI